MTLVLKLDLDACMCVLKMKFLASVFTDKKTHTQTHRLNRNYYLPAFADGRSNKKRNRAASAPLNPPLIFSNISVAS